MTALANQNGAGVAAQIAALTRRVAALEARPQQQSEQNSPNYLTVTPSGVVSVLFPGGVVMPEATGVPLVPTSAMQWQDTGSVVREYIQGVTPIAGAHELDIIVQADAGTNPNNSAQITAHSEAANGQQTITLETTWGLGDSDPALIVIVSQDDATHRDYVRVQAKTNSRTIIDDLGESSFLQIVNTLQQFRIDVGQFINIPGTSSVVVNHNLGVVPQRFTLTPAVSAGITPGRLSIVDGSATSTQFTIQNADATSTDCYWMAFG